MPLDWFWLLLSFVFFRLFDIFKPWPISYVDRHVPGAWGTLFDDVLAGLAALMTVALLMRLSVNLG